MAIILDKWDSQVLLYAKGHFSTRREIKDIKTILAHRNAVDVEYISDEIVFFYLWDLFERLEIDKHNANMEQIVSSILFKPLFDDKTPFERFVYGVLGQISILRIRDDNGLLVQYEQADYSIMPPSECVLKRMEKSAAEKKSE